MENLDTSIANNNGKDEYSFAKLPISQQKGFLHCNTIIEEPEEDQKSSIAMSDKEGSLTR